MSSPLIAGRKTRLSGKRFARALLGFQARRPDHINMCVSGELKGKSHPSAPMGAGGMRNRGWQEMFAAARAKCAGGRARTRRAPAAA